MRLFGKDVTTQKVMDRVRERLSSRGLLPPSEDAGLGAAVEVPVDAFAFIVEAMAEHADATRGLPIETHRDGVGGRAVVLAKRAFRAVGQAFINEALGRQVAFNAQVLDGYAQLSAEVVRLRERLAELEQSGATVAPAPMVARPAKALTKRSSSKAPPPGEAARVEDSGAEVSSSGASQPESANAAATKSHATKSDGTKSEATKSEATRSEATRSEATKSNTTKTPSAKPGASAASAPKSAVSKLEPRKPAAPPGRPRLKGPGGRSSR
ncbi:MAG: hypothetical protein INH41_06585 [Myxococcaceae bacterium]|jgi:hypothetical protein|nr:hypothetical protein [Myxococcaceae bacterium]MCA3012056.1 hypothetical protein [Myxococcaceae bacterium]